MKLFVSFLVCGAIGKSRGAFNQDDEEAYLQNFDEIVAASYAAVDDLNPDNPNAPPSDLISNCKRDGTIFQGPPTTEINVTSVSQYFVKASSVQTQCGINDICLVPFGLVLQMDTSLNVGAMIVRGEVEWNDVTQLESSQYLCAGYIVMEQGGSFDMTLSDKNGWIYIKDNGAVHPKLRSRAFGAYAADGSDSSVGIMGRELARTWSLLSEPLEVGESQMKLLHDPLLMGWNVGDRLGIAPTEQHSKGWGQVFVILALTDNGAITLSEAARHNHKAEFVLPVGRQVAALKSAEVVNLSRNIVITGDDFSHIDCDPTLSEAVASEDTSVDGCRCSRFRTKCTVGLHAIQNGGGVSRIQNIRLEKCGQRGIEGKYCFHFHKIKECPDCLFKNNAIEYGHQRGVIVHGTHLSNIEGNVLYNVRGAGIYFEDGNEMWNTVSYNIVICPFPFEHGTHHGCTVPGTSNRLSDTSDNQSSFYGHAGSNNLIGNRASNSFNGMFLFEGGTGRGEVSGKVCESAARLGRYEGNTFHGHQRFGTYALGSIYPKITDQSAASDGTNMDKSLCQGFDSQGNTRGLPGSFLNHVDYDSVFVGHYSAGDLQHNGHFSTDNLSLVYWKETKNFENGCAAHIVNGFYARGTMALPDQGTFIMENTVFGNGVMFEACHHCNVGITGVLCMPQYVLHGARWQNNVKDRKWVEFQQSNGQPHSANQMYGGIFTLSPADAAVVTEGGELADSFFPDEFVSLVSEKFTYLLDVPNNMCMMSSQYGILYDGGILCKVPLRALKVYTRGLVSYFAPRLRVEIWFDSLGTHGRSSPPDSVQEIGFHQIGADYATNKQGYSVPVIPGVKHYYKISLDGNYPSLPSDWVIEFSDPIIGNRWAPEYLNLDVEGRQCGVISSQHDRKYIWSGGDFINDEAWGRHGACVAGEQPPDVPTVDCEIPDAYGSEGLIQATECPKLCFPPCDNAKSYCDCGTNLCRCRPGYEGAFCQVDVCAAARCGDHGVCSARYLGRSSNVPVISKQACICEDDWSGSRCDRNPCLEQAKICPNGKCRASDDNAVCLCDPGYSGANCEHSCAGFCQGSFPFGCAIDIPGKAALGCNQNGGCYYLDQGLAYPFDGFCSYKVYIPIPPPTMPPVPSTGEPDTGSDLVPVGTDCSPVGPVGPTVDPDFASSGAIAVPFWMCLAKFLNLWF